MELSEQWFLLFGTMAYMLALALTLVRLSRRRSPLHGFNLAVILSGWLLQSVTKTEINPKTICLYRKDIGYIQKPKVI